MKLIPKTLTTAMLAAGLLAFGAAHAGTVIYNTGSAATATVALGVNDAGHLNTTPNITVNATATGLAKKFADGTWHDATAPGCLCEGWGVSADTTSGTNHGAASVDSGGIINLSNSAPTAVTGSTVTTNSWLTDLSGLTVTQAYGVGKSGVMFKDTVTITNKTGGDLTNVKYVRAMDWDVPPTEFDEYVTIKGTATTTLLEYSNDNGFCNPDPTVACSPILHGPGDFTDSGPTDHGAYFRFNFGALKDGESYTFNIFYGATDSERTAIDAIATEGLELYSLGEQAGDPTGGTPATFIFGFSGVGGTVIEHTPEPASLALAGIALLAMGASRRRRTAA